MTHNLSNRCSDSNRVRLSFMSHVVVQLIVEGMSIPVLDLELLNELRDASFNVGFL